MVLPNNYLNVKYLKLVNHVDSNRRDWSYKDDGDFFELHWIMKSAGSHREKMLARKEKDAKKANKGDQILLCQNNCPHGHLVTHLVEVIDEYNETKCKDDVWKRQVKVVWIAKEPWRTAPYSEHILGKKFSFRSGNLVSVNASTVELNLEPIYSRIFTDLI